MKVKLPNEAKEGGTAKSGIYSEGMSGSGYTIVYHSNPI